MRLARLVGGANNTHLVASRRLLQTESRRLGQPVGVLVHQRQSVVEGREGQRSALADSRGGARDYGHLVALRWALRLGLAGCRHSMIQLMKSMHFYRHWSPPLVVYFDGPTITLIDLRLNSFSRFGLFLAVADGRLSSGGRPCRPTRLVARGNKRVCLS